MMKKMFQIFADCIVIIVLILILSIHSLLAQKVIQIEAGANQINIALSQAAPNDTIELITSGGLYQEDSSVVTSFPLTIRAAENLAEKPVWELSTDSKLLRIGSSTLLKGIRMSGLFTDDTTDYKDSSDFAIRNDDVIDYGYKLVCENVDFDHLEHAFRPKSEAPYASEIIFLNCRFTDMRDRTIRFSDPTTEPWQFGSLRIENCTAANIADMFLRIDPLESYIDTVHIFINHCTFYNVADNVIRVHPYRSDLIVKNCIFYNTGTIVLGPTGSVSYCDTVHATGIDIWGDPVPDISHIFSEDPGFVDPQNYDFTVSNTFARVAIGDDGLTVGDPRWAPLNENLLYVPSEKYPTIQSGIDSAINGDTVLVGVGRYYENININGKKIMLGSRFILNSDTSYISETIIDGSQPSNPDSGSVVYFVSGEDTNTILCGFTITGGSGTNTIWEDSDFKAGGGVFIFLSGGQVINNKIINNAINSNDMYCYGAGIAAYGNTIIIRNNDISRNTVNSYWGGGAGADIATTETLIFEGNTVYHNIYTALNLGAGGGICILGNDFPGMLDINCNLISDNQAHGSSDYSYGYGGGLYIEGHNPILTNNIIISNKSGDGGGIYITTPSGSDKTADPIMINNTVIGNESRYGGGIYIRNSFSKVINTILWDNQATVAEPEIYQSNSTVNVHYSDVAGGWNGEGNMDEDPECLDTNSGDYRLTESSPCIGAGIEAIEIDTKIYYCPSTDFYGNPRPNVIDDYVDIGAIESDIVSQIENIFINYPSIFTLDQNYPNPFNPSTKIKFSLPRTENVKIEVYNIIGQKIQTLLNKSMPAGYHEIEFNGENLSSGVYLYKIEAGTWQDVKKMILIR